MLIRQTFAYLPAQLLGPLTQFATAIILTHYLGAADYGLTMLIFASQELVFMVCLSWWTIYMLRYGGGTGDPDSQRRFRVTESSILVLTTGLQVLATLAIVAISEPGVAPAFYLGACLFTVTRSYLGFLAERARRDAAILAYSIVQIIPPLAGLGLTLAALILLGPKPELVLLIFAAAQGAIGLGVAARLGLLVRPGALDRATLAAAFAFGIPVVISSAFGWLASNGIRFIVQFSAGAAALGLLSVGWGLATRLSTVAAMVVTAAAYPLAVKAMEAGDPEGARRQLSDNSALLMGIIAPATLGVIAINEPMVRLLIAADYHAATIAILPWALAGAAIRNLRMHGWDQLYLLFEAPRPMLVLEITEAAITLLAAALGMWFGGILGAVIGTVLAAFIVAAGDFLYLRARFGLHAPLWQYARILLASAAMLLAILALPRLGLAIRPHWDSLSLAIFYGMAVYIAAMALLFPEVIRLVLGKIRTRQMRG